jgi:hypothetical protein
MPLRPGHPATLEVGYLDGWFFLIAHGELLFHHELPLSEEWPHAFPPDGVENRLYLAVAGGGAEVRALRTFHDVYYQARRAPFGPPAAAVELQPGELFLLGDNTFESRDSRSGRAFPRADLVGTPIAVVGPVERMRWLTR